MKKTQSIEWERPILDYRSPLTYELMMEYINVFSERYKNIAVAYIGESILGRAIPAVTLGDPCTDSGVLYVGAHHGMEWITSVLLLRFINEFCENLETSKQMYGLNMSYLVRTRHITVIPMLNPDGVNIQITGVPDDCPMGDRLLRMNGSKNFKKWQANARGVDLNHNYAAGFAEYKVIEAEAGIDGGCATKFSGEYPESEPETGALANLLRYDGKTKALLTLHTQGKEIYCGSGGAETLRIGRIISQMCGYELCRPEGTAAYGGLSDWYTAEFARPAFTLECGRGQNPLPLADYFKIYAGLREVLYTFPAMI